MPTLIPQPVCTARSDVANCRGSNAFPTCEATIWLVNDFLAARGEQRAA